MLDELLDGLTPQLLHRVQSDRAPALLKQLVAALRRGQLDASGTAPEVSPGTDAESFASAVRSLKEAVYAAIVDSGRTIAPRELFLAADWFGALADEALRAQNRRLVAMLDALPDTLILQDTELRYLFLNRAASEVIMAMVGLSRERLVGRRVLDFPFPEPFKQYISSVSERVNRGETVRDEFLQPGPDGATWQEHFSAPIFGSDGKVEAFAVASRDIQARKVAEARLHLLSKISGLAGSTEYEEVLDGVARLSVPELADWCLIDVFDDGWGRRRKVAHRDPAKAALAEQLLYLAPEQGDLSQRVELLPGGRFLVGELDQAGIRERDPKLYDALTRLGATSIMIVPFFVLGAPIAATTFVFSPESGRHHGAEDLAVAQEAARLAAQIVENARLQERLRRSEARFRVALERSNIAVFEADADFQLRWTFNPRFGLDGGSGLDEVASERLPVEIAEELERVKPLLLETGQGMRVALDATMSGDRRHLLVNYEPLRATGGIVGITGAAVDITETKRIQDELAQELAFRERVMGILGHDLRNPLSAVLALSALLALQDGVPDKTKEGLARIRQAADRMNEMIEAILDFTRIRFHGLPALMCEALELDVLASRIVDELRVAHPGRVVEIEARGNLRGQWDPGRIGQVISNLVGNALTHGARESPIELALLGDDGTVVLAISNRGPAIPPVLLERLFEPFWQAPTEGNARPSGLGLGLFIVRQIVLAHGGRVEVSSRDEVTTFSVHLPRSR